MSIDRKRLVTLLTWLLECLDTSKDGRTYSRQFVENERESREMVARIEAGEDFDRPPRPTCEQCGDWPAVMRVGIPGVDSSWRAICAGCYTPSDGECDQAVEPL